MYNPIYKEAIETFGKQNQMKIAQEECAELIVAISKVLRYGEGQETLINDLAEEIADVEIMCCQLRQCVDNSLIDRMKEHKLVKLQRLIDTEKQ